MPVGMAPGHFSESLFFPCGPLELEEFNLDYRGNLTLCCQLSGYRGRNSDVDSMGNLEEMSLMEACARFRQRVDMYLAAKQRYIREHALAEEDYFPCLYCAKYMSTVSQSRPDSFTSFSNLKNFSGGRRNNVHVESQCSGTS